MVALKQACLDVLKNHSSKRIHIVNEYERFYQFLLLNKSEKVTGWTFIGLCTIVDKESGQIIEDVSIADDRFFEPYKQYLEEDLEKL